MDMLSKYDYSKKKLQKRRLLSFPKKNWFYSFLKTLQLLEDLKIVGYRYSMFEQTSYSLLIIQSIDVWATK